MSDLLQDFFQETDRNLSQVSGELDRWAQAPRDPEALNSLFRIVHNIKATCHVMGFGRIEDLAHAAEDLLFTIREGQAEPGPDAVAAVRDALTQIEALLQEVRVCQAEPQGDDRALIERIAALAGPEDPLDALGIEGLLDELKGRAEAKSEGGHLLPDLDEITETGLFPESETPFANLPDLETPAPAAPPLEAADSSPAESTLRDIAPPGEADAGPPVPASPDSPGDSLEVTAADLAAFEIAISDLTGDEAEAEEASSETPVVEPLPDFLTAEAAEEAPPATAAAPEDAAAPTEAPAPEAEDTELLEVLVEGPLDDLEIPEPPAAETPTADMPVPEAPAMETPVAETPMDPAPIAESPVAAAPEVDSGRLTAPVGSLHANPGQPRQRMEDEGLQDLARSIATHGIIQPILVRPHADLSGQFQIVAGERRWRAATLAGLEEVPVTVVTPSEAVALELSLVENLQREDLSAIEEAKGYQQLMEGFGLTQEEAAQRVGKSRSHVTNTLRLLALPPAVQEMLQRGALTAGHARALLALESPEPVAQEVVDKGLSVRETEALARQPAARLAADETDPMPAGLKDELKTLERELSDLLDLRVKVRLRGDKGEVRLRFDSLQDLENLMARLRRLSRSDAA